MKLYVIGYTDSKGNDCAIWAGTQAIAKRHQSTLEQNHGKHNVDDYRSVEVPTSKDDLIAFLNSYLEHPSKELP